MSLTSWLTEYVFNPAALALRRKASQFPKEKRKKLRTQATYAAILLTFAVSGVWHGAGMMFVAWGLAHGILSVLHAVYVDWVKKNHTQLAIHKPWYLILLDVLLNFMSVVMIEAFFTTTTFREGISFFKSLFCYHTGIVHFYIWIPIAYFFMITGILLGLYHKKKNNLKQIEAYYPVLDLRSVKGLTVFFVFIGLTVILGYYGETFFMYGNF